MSLYGALRNSAFKKLIPVSLGWCLVALLESFTYIAIAFAILKQWPIEIIITTGVLSVFFTIIVTRAGFHVGAKLASSLYNTIFEVLMRIKVTWFSINNRAQLVKLNTQQIPSFMSIPAHQLQHFIHAPMLPLVITIAMFWICGYQVALLLSILLFMSLFMQYHAQRALAKTDQQRTQTDKIATQSVLELVEHVELLRCASGYQGATHRIEQAWTAQEKALKKTNKVAALATFYSAIAMVIPCLGVLLFLYFTGVKQSEIYFIVTLLTLRATFPMEALALAALGINDQYVAYKNYRDILTAPKLIEPKTIQEKPFNDFTLTLNNIVYQPIFNDFSCTIKSGTRALFCGASGTGKSTLLHLLMRFDDPQQGEVKVGGTLLSAIPLQQRASYFAYVPQIPIIFNGTIASNIRISKPDASDEDVEKVARKMMLGNLLDRSPLGINQSVGEQGVSLSGGERQRIVLAQALLKNAPILVLDEATSALDTQTEKKVVEELKQLKCTILIITHRSSTIWQAQQMIHLS